MMGRKKLSEIKAELGLSAAPANGKSSKAKEDVADLENDLFHKLVELEREVKTRRKAKTKRPAKR
jgi:hypothetical protein